MTYTKEQIRQASEQLVKIADAMENTEPGTPFYKELSRDYKAYSKIALSGLTKKTGHLFTKAVIKASRKKALEKIVSLLSSPDKMAELEKKDGTYYSKDKFIVSWSGNWKGIPSEFSLDKTDSLYKAMSGLDCIYAVRSLVHEKQLGGYNSIERGLLEIGLKLCLNLTEQKLFFEKFGVPYNQKLKNNE